MKGPSRAAGISNKWTRSTGKVTRLLFLGDQSYSFFKIKYIFIKIDYDGEEYNFKIMIAETHEILTMWWVQFQVHLILAKVI